MSLEKPWQCNDCPFAARGRGFVPGAGPVDAAIVLIGEAPAEEELAAGLPFQGPAGQELNAMLEHAGLRRADIYITNAIKCALPHDDIDEATKHRWAAACNERHGRAELNALNPNIFGLLGGVAMTEYSRMRGIFKHRGYVTPDDRDVKAMALIHPAATMRWDRSRNFRMVAKADWKKLARLAATPALPDLQENFVISPQFDDVMLFLSSLLKHGSSVSYDIETTGLNIKDCTVTCIGLCNDAGRTICIPFFRDNSDLYWEAGQLTEIVRVLAAIFAAEHITKIATNQTFDESVLSLRGFVFRGPRVDACYWHHTLFAELPHSLAFLGSVYTDAPFWKDDVKGYDKANSNENRDVDQVYWTYNCKDAHYTRQIVHAIKAESDKKGRTSFYERIVAPVLPAVADMQATGIRFDYERRNVIANQMEAELQQLEERCYELLGKRFQINSKPELGEIIFGEMGYTPTKFTPKAHRPVMDKDVVRWLYHNALNERDVAFFGALTQYNKEYKSYSTYVVGEDVQPCSDGRIRASWKVHGTKTGRLACGEPNFMNIPDGLLRELYLASEGRTFINIDMDAFEAWIGALIADDETMLDVLRNGKSPHVQNAVTFGICPTYEEADALRNSKDPTFAQTYLALKNYFYGEQYGAEPKTIWEEMYARMDHPPDLSTVARWHSLHRAAHPAFTRMRDEITSELRRNRLLRNGFGRERYFRGPGNTIITEGYNFPIQSLGADILLQVQSQLFRALPSVGIIVAQVHDSLLLDTPTDLVSEVIALTRSVVSQPFTFKGWRGQDITFSFPCSFKTGPNWGQLKGVAA